MRKRGMRKIKIQTKKKKHPASYWNPLDRKYTTSIRDGLTGILPTSIISIVLEYANDVNEDWHAAMLLQIRNLWSGRDSYYYDALKRLYENKEQIYLGHAVRSACYSVNTGKWISHGGVGRYVPYEFLVSDR